MNDQSTLERIDDEERFKSRSAGLFIAIIKQALDDRGEAYVALSGGSTPLPIFEYIRTEFVDTINWENVSFLWVDERTVPPTHQDSNFGNACDVLLNYLPDVKTYRMKGEDPPEKAAEEYAGQLQTVVPAENGLPRFDLLWLGMGTDGHTASLFPNGEGLDEKDDWVKSVWVDKLETYRLTLTFPVINNARNRMIVINGQEKLAIFNEIQELEAKKYPIQYLDPSNAIDYWIIGTD
jgi:6-phosphogluconolactonase